MGLKLFTSDGSFLGFRRAVTFAFRHSLGIVLPLAQLLKKRSSQSLAFGPKCLMSSVWMSSRHVGSLFFSALIPASISVSLKGLVNPGSLGVSFSIKACFGLFVCLVADGERLGLL